MILEPEYIIGVANELRAKGASHTDAARYAVGTSAIAKKLDEASACYHSAARWESVALRLIAMRLFTYKKISADCI